MFRLRVAPPMCMVAVAAILAAAVPGCPSGTNTSANADNAHGNHNQLQADPLAKDTGRDPLENMPTVTIKSGEDVPKAVTSRGPIRLSCDSADDRIMKQVSEQRNVIVLDVSSSTKITSQGYLAIASMVQLRELYLGGSSFTDKDADVLATLSELEHLVLSWTIVSDPTMKIVGELSKLRQLHVSGSNITDIGLSHIRGLKLSVFVANLCPGITNVGLEALANMNTLTYIRLGGCVNVTERGIFDLQKRLPEAQIEFRR